VEDRLRGLEAGADDYVGKPCDVRELVLRAQVVDRRRTAALAPVRPIAERPKRIPLRADAHANDPVKLGSLEVDPVMHEVRVGGDLTPLRPIEFRLLRVLVSRPGRIYSREELLDGAWGVHAMLGVVNPRTVDVHVRRLRQNLGAAADMIETVHRFGYRARRVA
jgi:two-component system phosphate regulon response regulator PhoB